MSRTNTGWKVLGRTVIGSNPWVRSEVWQVRHSSFQPGRVEDYTIHCEYDYIQVVGYTKDGQAILITQDRVANGISLEAVAGGIGPGETPEQAAIREWLQESGWQCEELIFLRSSVPQTDRIVSRTP